MDLRLGDYAVLSVAVLVVIDGLMTLPYWHLEGNPVVLALGPWGMMGVKLAAVCALVYVWFSGTVDTTHYLSRTCVWSLTALYGLVVVTNVAVLMG